MSRHIEYLKLRYNAILHYIGTIILGVGFITLIPLVIIFFYPNEFEFFWSFLYASLIGIIIGLLLRFLFDLEDNDNLELQEAAVIVLGIWIISVFIGALPFYFSGNLTFLDGIFEAMSGWTTTGLTMVAEETAPHIILFWRSLMQFVGGAGFIVLMLSAVIGPTGLGLYRAEARSDKLVPNIIHTTKLILKLYFGFFVMGVILYLLVGMGFFDSINHTMAALSTGGFSTRDASIGYYKSLPIEIVTIFLMLIGTTNFATHYALLTSKFKKGYRDVEMKLLGVLIIVTVPIVTLLLTKNLFPSVFTSFRIAIFNVISAISTTGFGTASFQPWDKLSVFVVIILMIIGGGTGATAGGIKLYRGAIAFKGIYWDIKNKFNYNNAIFRRVVNRQGKLNAIDNDHIAEVLSFISLYIFSLLLGTAVFLYYGYPLTESLFEFATALGTVGLSIGITGPDMPTAAKIAQIFGMFLGRLEFFAIIIAITKLYKDIRDSLKYS